MNHSILVVVGHPDKQSLNMALAEAYAEAARQQGAHVELVMLGELAFDPVLHKGYRGNQALEPALQQLTQTIEQSAHLVLVYPLWWGGFPALLKGFFDRVLLPGFAFRYVKGPMPEKLLKGRTAEVIATMDTPPWYHRWIYRAPDFRQLRNQILGFVGYRILRMQAVGPVRGSSVDQRSRWLEQARQSGLQAGLRVTQARTRALNAS